MRLIPAIDIRGGKVVRLTQGDYAREKVYAESPLEVAKKWDSYGVEMIHLVDLDGALEGKLRNLEIVREIARSVKAALELGGGIRSEAAVSRVLDAGVDKVVVGTMALSERFMRQIGSRFRESIVAAIDARGGIVHTKGWLHKTRIRATMLARRLEEIGVTAVNYTDISTDGMLKGPNLLGIEKFLEHTKIPVVAGGGISTIEDVRELKRFEGKGLSGMIVGKALYEGTVDIAEALAVARAPDEGKD